MSQLGLQSIFDQSVVELFTSLHTYDQNTLLQYRIQYEVSTINVIKLSNLLFEHYFNHFPKVHHAGHILASCVLQS